MSLTIKIISDHRELLGDDFVREFDEKGGTIGRSLRNDWVLPDPDRFISGRHATIDHRGGMYYLADTSTNGVFMNGEREPVGNGNPRRLFDGDRFRMGDFEFEVSLEKGESISMPLDSDAPSVDAANVQQFVEEDLPDSGVDLLDEEEITGDDAFRSVLFGSGPKAVARQPEPEPEPVPEIRAAPKPAPVSAPPRAPSPFTAGKAAEPRAAGSPGYSAQEITAEDLFDSFLDGLGVSRIELHPSVDRAEAMLTAGMVLREFVEGMVKMLASRANLKSAFALEQTMLLPRHNNPMKFSDNPAELVKQLLVGGGGEYLSARDAVREVNHDLLNHQEAFLDAMSSAFVEFADRLDPDELEQQFDSAPESKKVLGFLKKSKYWDLYREFYPAISEKGSNRLPQMFSEAFVDAYEQQVAEFQRRSQEGTVGRGPANDDLIEEELLATVRRGPPSAADGTGDQ